MPQSNADILISPSLPRSGSSIHGPLHTLSRIRKSKVALLPAVRRRLAGSKLITGQERLMKAAAGHGPQRDSQLLHRGIRTPTTAPQVGDTCGGTAPVAILGIGGAARGWPGVPACCWLLQEATRNPEASSEASTQATAKAPGGSVG